MLVILLSGQKIDVSCNTMTTAGDVFDAVMAHTNLSETIFFGLTYLRGAYYLSFFCPLLRTYFTVCPFRWRTFLLGKRREIVQIRPTGVERSESAVGWGKGHFHHLLEDKVLPSRLGQTTLQ